VTAAKPTNPRVGWIVFASAIGFLGGMVVMAAVITMYPESLAVRSDPLVQAAMSKVEVKPTRKGEPAPIAPPTSAVTVPPPSTSGSAPVESLRLRNLTLPVKGIQRDELRDTFNEMRGSSRRHEALDVLAPRNTPVLAVEDGTIAKLFISAAGGITIYQFDPTRAFCYYYAHLERYADGLKEGATVKRGEVIGYVGTTGNAPRDTPHLHFAIFELTDEKKWWQGTAIDPYSVLR
jgi:murein DD-endopeptidase MepM/ murein hydrolase activator NlpD